MKNKKIEEVMLEILQAKALEIRDVEQGEEPFYYTSDNRGPGYVSIKNLVGRKKIIKFLCQELAKKVANRVPQLEFVAGNVTGGVIPGWLLSEYLEPLLGKTVPFVYIRKTRKKGGQEELITGIANNPEIQTGANGLVVEELVNYGQTIYKGVKAIRQAGYTASHGACILFYNNPDAIKLLKEAGIKMVYLFTLAQLLDIAEKYQTHPQKLIDDCREFLKEPLDWQRKLKPKEEKKKKK